ncbi:C-type lectin domain family 17, member A-like [Fundulus heteroclitus]|uniref:C-type lectin domain family 17, member A-like n=1 Tax=Fundulus heteroclitus TaxID=8078 RepID=UPI00165B8EE1|nr:C-type lectin domain family 17, member A-like [Fundulus heteroclitus]
MTELDEVKKENQQLHEQNVQVHNMTQEKEILKIEHDKVKNTNQELQKEKKILTEQIQTMEKTWNEQNVSRAQWSVDEYCPKENKRKCSPCQKGWLLSQSSCYSFNNAEPPNQKTWEEAREICRGKISDLTVVGDEEEKKFVKDKSWVNKNITGYWIGLRAEGGKWRWIDGSDLTNQAWIQQQPAVDGQCVTSLRNREWRSESCDENNAWLCEKKALSV